MGLNLFLLKVVQTLWKQGCLGFSINYFKNSAEFLLSLVTVYYLSRYILDLYLIHPR